MGGGNASRNTLGCATVTLPSYSCPFPMRRRHRILDPGRGGGPVTVWPPHSKYDGRTCSVGGGRTTTASMAVLGPPYSECGVSEGQCLSEQWWLWQNKGRLCDSFRNGAWKRPILECKLETLDRMTELLILSEEDLWPTRGEPPYWLSDALELSLEHFSNRNKTDSPWEVRVRDFGPVKYRLCVYKLNLM